MYIYKYICIHISGSFKYKEHDLLAAFRVSENSWQTTLLQKAFKIIVVLVNIGVYPQSAR